MPTNTAIATRSFLVLQFRRARARHKSPQGQKHEKNTKKIRKKYILGWAPKMRINYRQKYKDGHVGPFLYFFGVFFCIFRAHPRVGDFVFLFVFPALGDFCALYEPDGIAILVRTQDLQFREGSKLASKSGNTMRFGMPRIQHRVAKGLQRGV